MNVEDACQTNPYYNSVTMAGLIPGAVAPDIPTTAIPTHEVKISPNVQDVDSLQSSNPTARARLLRGLMRRLCC